MIDANINELSQESSSATAHKQPSVSPRELVFKYLPFLPWVLLSVFLSLLVAYVKLRYSPNIYNITSTILIKDQSPYASKSDKFDDILGGQSNRNLNDEIQLIRSRSMAKRVIRSLGMEIGYYSQGKIRSSLIYPQESPLRLTILALKDTNNSFTIPINLLDNGQFSMTENGTPTLFGRPFENSFGTFIIDYRANLGAMFPSPQFFINYTPSQFKAGELVGNLNAAQSGESTNILQLNFTTENPKMGIDVVNQWMKEYQRAGLDDKKQAAVSALNFIDEQMDAVKAELGGVERNLQTYREKNKVINPTQQSLAVFSTLSELDKEINKQNVQLKVVENLIAYIADTKNPYKKVGSTLGIIEPTLSAQILEFNNLQVQREVLLKTTTITNPLVVDVEASIEKLRVGIIQNLSNIKQAYQVTLRDLNNQNEAANKAVALFPAKEKQLLDITRQQKILEELFSFLLQKKLETSISSASTLSNVRVIEPAMTSGAPVLPKKSSTYLIAFFIGLLIPAGIIFLFEFLNDRIKGRDDITRGTSAPIVGEIGHSDEKGVMVVKKTSRRFIAEQFRIIRSNLQYVLPAKEKIVILITSSTSGEGKSFVSTNVGAVFALTGKKTVILEFDIRKPKVISSLGMGKSNGITNYLIGNATFDELPVPVPAHDNLFVIPCGPIPPNPAEMLLDKNLEILFSKVKENFEVVIIDTAPIGLVSDAVTLGKFADATLYILRHNYTYKKQLQLLNEVYLNKRLPRIALVVNDIKRDGPGYGRYYGYGGSSYTGYGYGSETDYFDNTKSSSKASRLFSSLGKLIKWKTS